MSSDNQLTSKAAKGFSFSGALDTMAHRVQVIGAAVLCGMMIFTFIHVLMRYFFNAPYRGEQDITMLASLTVTWLGVAWGQVRKSHLQVDIITTKLSARIGFIVQTSTYLLTMAVVAIMVWQGAKNTLYFIENTRSSTNVAIPLAPFAVLIPIGAFLLLLILLRDFISNLKKSAGFNFKSWQWLLMIGVPVIILGLMYFWMLPACHGVLPRSTVAFLGIGLGLVLIFLGMPIGPSLAITGFVFVGNLKNASQGFMIAGADLFWQSADYSWSTIQLFILMSEFIVISGVGADAFSTAYRWLGRLRGGLAIATIGGCTLLAAVVGIPAPVIYAMGSVALPAMRKYKYSDILSAGVIASGSCLGPLIPPSVSFIFYGIFTGVSIGKLFIAGFIPGLILSFGFMLTIYIMCRINPAFGGAGGDQFTWKEKFGSFKTSTPIMLLFILVMGGIYMGVFTTTEGGGIGAFLALVIALFMRRVNWSNFKGSMMEAARTNSIMIFMVMGSMIMGRVLTVGGLGTMLSNFLGNLSPSMVVIAIMIFYLIIGFFVDTVTVLILTMPILTPILKATGIDMIWFGVELVMVINLGGYTPPYGLNMFILASSTDLKLGTIYRGVWPFVLCNAVVIVFLFLVPSIVTWLPYAMKG
jgi:C4-dicarboxylate transporter, DctM subunit